MQTWHAIILGLIEGATEFLPVSSTGHVLLAGHLLGTRSPGRAFEVLIQLGAILAILSVYAWKLIRLLIDLPSDQRTQRFVLGVLIAFLPAAVIGAIMHGSIKALFEKPMVICVALILGGVVLLWVDRLKLTPRYRDVMDFPLLTSLAIGICQCAAMIPGVSRSGSTIVGGMLLGADKRSAAEFSFFLAMPTMAGAFAYDLYKNWKVLQVDDVVAISVGFAVAFVSALLVVRFLLDYVSRHGFALFGWWRIVVGGIGLGALLITG